MADTGQFVVEEGVGKRAALISVSDSRGAVMFEKFQEIVDFSVYMSKSGQAVPAFLRQNPGGCMAITIQATEWSFSPYAVARMAFVVNDQIAYLAQLLHAVVERRAPLKQRLRFDFEGEGPDLRVIVTGHLKGEVDPLIYESPRFKDIKTKNSPLWQSDPKQQFSYYGARAWARRYVPDVLLGAYAADELDGAATQHIGAENAKDITPETEGLQHRLSAKAAAGAGFDPGGIAATLNEASGKGATENSTVASRAASVAEAAVPPEPPTPVGIVDAAAVNSPAGSGGDASAHGGQAQETAAATPTSAAAVEPQKRRGRPPKAAAPVETVAEPVAPNVDSSFAGDEVPPADPESPVESAPQEHVPPAHEDVAGLVPATSEGAVSDDLDDDLPDDGPTQDRVPDPPLPDRPTDGRYYPGYVRVMLRQSAMQDEAYVREWWSSFEQKTLRNGLPNYTSELSEKAKRIVTEHLRALKGD